MKLEKGVSKIDNALVGWLVWVTIVDYARLTGFCIRMLANNRPRLFEIEI